MKTLDEIREYFAGDRFAQAQGMQVDNVSEDGAVCSVEIREDHRNALGGVQGGFLFTLADFAFAVAANHEESGTVTLDSDIRFLRGCCGSRLTATARCQHRGRAVCTYRIDVEDELGTLVAQVSVTGYTPKRERK